MRDIKFRVWIACKDGGYMEHFDLFSAGTALSSWDHKTPIMQYTGIKDSKGTEIYEGDIVIDTVADRFKWLIFWNNNGGWMLKTVSLETALKEIGIKEKPRYAQFIGNNLKENEIIGNMFQNPELIENKDLCPQT